MTTRFASAAALVLALSLPATSALAQGYAAPGVIVAAPAPNAYVVSPYDDLTTGSLTRRSVDSSAKEGNAEQLSRTVPNYGTTSGGPAY